MNPKMELLLVWSLGLEGSRMLNTGVDVVEEVVLGGSWLVISRVISRVSILVNHSMGRITRHEPPSFVEFYRDL